MSSKGGAGLRDQEEQELDNRAWKLQADYGFRMEVNLTTVSSRVVPYMNPLPEGQWHKLFY